MKDHEKNTPVWERPEAVPRPAPGPLSREAILQAALALADAEGLPSVSIRKVAAALRAGPMRLYTHLTTKEELFDLMVDQVYGELLAAGPLPQPWPEALRVLGARLRQVALAHPWFIALHGGRPHMGPNSLAYVEMALAALVGTPGFDNIEMVLMAVRTVNAYVIGAMQTELRERRSGMDRQAWQASTRGYMERLMATGRFPMLSVYAKAKQLDEATVFARGLACVIAGIAQQVAGQEG